MLIVTGEAEGPTREFLSFIEKSPVNGMIDHFTDSWQAQGAGKLTLKLELPLRATEKGQVSGAYQFAANTVVADPDLPAIEQASGRVEFTEASVHAQGITGTFVGGPITISASSQKDGTVRINAQGRVSADNVRRAGNVPPWLQGMRGATDWRVDADRAEARVRHRDRIRPAGTRAGPARAARQGGRRCASSALRAAFGRAEPGAPDARARRRS